MHAQFAIYFIVAFFRSRSLALLHYRISSLFVVVLVAIWFYIAGSCLKSQHFRSQYLLCRLSVYKHSGAMFVFSQFTFHALDAVQFAHKSSFLLLPFWFSFDQITNKPNVCVFYCPIIYSKLASLFDFISKQSIDAKAVAWPPSGTTSFRTWEGNQYILH